MPSGLGLKIETIICEGDRCAVQAESNTIAANGKKYNNLYHFDIRFDGDKIAEVREYNDTNHAREVFFSSSCPHRPSAREFGGLEPSPTWENGYWGWKPGPAHVSRDREQTYEED